MMIVMATLLFSFVHRMGSFRYRRLIWTLTSMVISYPLTILVNGLRILLAIYLPPFFARNGLYGNFLTPDRLHTAIGVVVYFSALLVIHHFAEEFVTHLSSRYIETDMQYSNKSGSITEISKITSASAKLLHLLHPVFWYFLLVLGVPFLNRAYQKNGPAFKEYALLVSLVCDIILLPILLIRQMRKR